MKETRLENHNSAYAIFMRWAGPIIFSILGLIGTVVATYSLLK